MLCPESRKRRLISYHLAKSRASKVKKKVIVSGMTIFISCSKFPECQWLVLWHFQVLIFAVNSSSLPAVMHLTLWYLQQVNSPDRNDWGILQPYAFLVFEARIRLSQC